MKIQKALLVALFPLEERLVQMTALTQYLSFLKIASAASSATGSGLGAACLADDITTTERLLDKLRNAYDPAMPEDEGEESSDAF